MRLSDFEYELPPQLIAQHPLPNRSASRLMEVINNQERDPIINDRQFNEILDLVKPGDLLVFNDTKVIPARLFGKKETGGAIEVMLERITGEYTAIAQVRASKTPKAGSQALLKNNGAVTSITIEGRENLDNL